MRPALLAALLAAAAPSRAELLLEVYAGKAFNLPTDLTLKQPGRGTDLTYRGVRLDDKSLRSPPYYGYRATWFPRRRSAVGLGLEFTHLKAIARTDARYRATGRLDGQTVDADARLGDVVQSFEVSHGLNFLTATVQARAPGPERARPYAGFGLGVTIPHAESEVRGRSAPSRYAFGSHPAFQAFGGVRGTPWKDLLAFGEYKYSRARLDAPVADGTISALFQSHQLLLGTGWRFAAGGD